MEKIKIHVLPTGEVRVSPYLPFGGDDCSIIKASGITTPKSKWIWLPVFSFLIEHPKGKILFDAGNASNNACYLYAAYYNAHREAIDEVATTDTISGGGYGIAGAREMKVIRPYSLSIGNMPNQLVEAVVDEESTLADEHCHGNIGIAAVLQHKKTILNFRDMFVKFEK